MIVIIPLGGIGSRFKENGYSMPKALVKVFGKPILFWLLDSLVFEPDTTIYIPYNKEYSSYRFEDMLQKAYPKLKLKFLVLNNDTRGAAETLNIALSCIQLPDQPILSLDADNFYLLNIIDLWNKSNSVFVFEDITTEPKYSYVTCNDHDEIIRIVEKEKISNNACCGGYGFQSYKELFRFTQYIIEHNLTQKGEFYTSTVIREMINGGSSFKMQCVPSSKFVCLGTPMQVRYFYNNFPKKSCLDLTTSIPVMRICFDLDNTLVTYPKITGDYSSVEPIRNNIEYLRYLKTFGHTIIIYTARRMKTHNGNVGKLMSDIGKITFETLERFSIPFDEIYFGKPQADIYIDDLGLNCFDNMEKSLGFYMDSIKPRDFNGLNINSIETYRKYSDDLSGEIFYYRNIPSKIKDLFPLFIDYDDQNHWYEIEKIQGLTLSVQYTSELLTEITLRAVLDSIKRIQSCEYNQDVEEIYCNYSSKLSERYSSYDFTLFPNHERTFDSINDSLKDYEKKRKGKICVIHGDPVFSNILVNRYNKIKFIDMRGKLGNKLAIEGDWLYDWAKVFQSLVGYDSIILNKDVSTSYKMKMIKVFSTYFIHAFSREAFYDLIVITKSLLFSLIPLHNNENCLDFYNLIDEIDGIVERLL